jgi:hypothetical protein
MERRHNKSQTPKLPQVRQSNDRDIVDLQIQGDHGLYFPELNLSAASNATSDQGKTSKSSLTMDASQILINATGYDRGGNFYTERGLFGGGALQISAGADKTDGSIDLGSDVLTSPRRIYVKNPLNPIAEDTGTTYISSRITVTSPVDSITKTVVTH